LLDAGHSYLDAYLCDTTSKSYGTILSAGPEAKKDHICGGDVCPPAVQAAVIRAMHKKKPVPIQYLGPKAQPWHQGSRLQVMRQYAYALGERTLHHTKHDVVSAVPSRLQRFMSMCMMRSDSAPYIIAQL
jgi:hypothetical protein